MAGMHQSQDFLHKTGKPFTFKKEIGINVECDINLSFRQENKGWIMKYNKLKQVAVGAGRILDFAHSYDSALHKKYLNTEARQIEGEALRSDWEKIGKDLKAAISKEADRNNLKHNHV